MGQIKILKIEKDLIKELTIENDLKDIQREVDGSLENVSTFEILTKNNILAYTNKDGAHRKDFGVTMLATDGDTIIDVIKGPIVLVGSSDRGNITSLTDEQIKMVRNKIYRIEYYNNIKNRYDTAYTF